MSSRSRKCSSKYRHSCDGQHTSVGKSKLARKQLHRGNRGQSSDHPKTKDVKLIKGPWMKEESRKLIKAVRLYGERNWQKVAKVVKSRTGKQCRERWLNHLAPGVNKGPWTLKERQIICRAQKELGNCWTRIAEMLPGRTENSIKNLWSSFQRKKMNWYCNPEGDNNPSTSASASFSSSTTTTSFSSSTSPSNPFNTSSNIPEIMSSNTNNSFNNFHDFSYVNSLCSAHLNNTFSNQSITASSSTNPADQLWCEGSTLNGEGVAKDGDHKETKDQSLLCSANPLTSCLCWEDTWDDLLDIGCFLLHNSPRPLVEWDTNSNLLEEILECPMPLTIGDEREAPAGHGDSAGEGEPLKEQQEAPRDSAPPGEEEATTEQSNGSKDPNPPLIILCSWSEEQ